MRKTILFLLVASLFALSPFAGKAQRALQRAGRPKLVVNIVVSGISYDRLEKFRPGLSDEGFARFAAQGMDFPSAHYGYMQTLSPVSLATLTTGVNPSMHGIVSTAWIDYVTGSRISLTGDESVRGLGGDAGRESYSPLHIVVPTLGDKLVASSPGSKVISIAADHDSAIVAGGQSGTAYWMDEARATWVSSSYYMMRLPDWVVDYNTARHANYYIDQGWTPARPARQYINRTSTVFQEGSGRRLSTFRNGNINDYGSLLQSPAGNSLVADFAVRIVAGEGLGQDDATDILNVCFDASRWVGQRYGGSSMEVEDMIYRLDMDLAQMVRAITAWVSFGDVLFVVTSDHGASDGWDVGGAGHDRFNVAQFKAILNSFLGVQFGTGEWVLDYIDRQVYLNHNLVYQMNLSLEEVQNRAATFVLQFRGVSHVLTSTALGGGYFGEGYGHRMQNSFYPRRAGDLMLNFMPGWIEERPDTKSLPGSMYDYDTHVPLMLFGWRIPAREVTGEVDMTRLAPTLARFIGISRPIASDGLVLPETESIR